MASKVNVSKVVHRGKKNNIGQYYVSVEYFSPFYEGGPLKKKGRILFFDTKKNAQKVIVGYEIRM